MPNEIEILPEDSDRPFRVHPDEIMGLDEDDSEGCVNWFTPGRSDAW